MSDAGSFLTLEGVSVYLRQGRTSAPIHWEIRNDQHWAVIGPNGSGKSRLVKAIAGQSAIAEGEIAYHFFDNGAAPHERIAYVSFGSQIGGLPFEAPFHEARWNSGVEQRTLSVSDYLSEQRVKRINPFQLVGERADPARFQMHRARTVKLLGIESLLARSVDQISNGERRKVLLARALLKRPRLLIIDNPFAGLDAGFRDKYGRILSVLMADGVRIILVTNGREPIPPGITHVLLMAGGKVVAHGSREVMLRALPAHVGSDPKDPAPFPGISASKDPATQAESLLQMRNVSVSYDGLQILDRVDWSVQPGEKWALLGPNGAGKTTLLSLILGDNPQAYANDITLFGVRRGSGESIWDIKRRIGWISPELHLYYPKNVPCFEVVCSGFADAIGPYRRCTSQQRETASGWLRRLGLLHVRDVAFGAVSEGEQRMILIARALVKGSELLVLDEPCQGLDAAHRDQVLRMVDAIDDHSMSSLIYVSHHRDALPACITHLLRLEGGRVVGRGRVHGVDTGSAKIGLT